MKTFRIKKEFPNSPPLGTETNEEVYGQPNVYVFKWKRNEKDKWLVCHENEIKRFPDYFQELENMAVWETKWDEIRKNRGLRPAEGHPYWTIGEKKITQSIWTTSNAQARVHLNHYLSGNVFQTEAAARQASEVFRKLFL